MEITSIISIIAVVVSILSTIITMSQNKKLQNENQKLSIEPNIDIDLLFDSLIGGQIMKKEYAIDSYNVWVSKYSEYYVDNLVRYDKSRKALFTIFVKNAGKGVANEICVENIEIETINENKSYNDAKMIFSSCDVGEKLANRIFLDVDLKEIKTVQLKISYINLMKNKAQYIYKYIVDDSNKTMLRYIGKSAL